MAVGIYASCINPDPEGDKSFYAQEAACRARAAADGCEVDDQHVWRELPAVHGTAQLPLLSDLRRSFRTTKSIGEVL